MVYLKYNFLAAYTKEVTKIFKNTNVEINSSILHKSNKFITINKLMDNKTYSDLFIDSLEDIPSIDDNNLTTFFDKYKGKCKVLFTFIPVNERLWSITNRYIRHTNSEINNIHDIISNLGYNHSVNTGMISISNEYKILPYFTFDKIILMEDFETLLELHKNNRVELIVLTKDTILNDKQKILNYLKIDYVDNKNSMNNLEFRTRKVQGSDKIKRLEIYNKTIEEYGGVISKRYEDINKLILENNIKVL